MNRSISLHPASLLIGILFCAVCFLSMSQVGVSKESWGPPKRDIVNVLARYDPNAGPISVPPGSSFSVYTVPTDRWLTITGVSGSYNNAVPYWSEEISGTATEKGLFSGTESITTPASCGGAIGWTFSPGSNVVIKNDDPTTTSLIFGYSLIGYLSRE